MLRSSICFIIVYKITTNKNIHYGTSMYMYIPPPHPQHTHTHTHTVTDQYAITKQYRFFKKNPSVQSPCNIKRTLQGISRGFMVIVLKGSF